MNEKLWHKEFIKVLPNKLLLYLYDNLSLYADNNVNNQTDNFPFGIYGNKIKEYNKSHFYNYCCEVYNEISGRKWTNSDLQIIEDCSKKIREYVSDEEKQIGASIPFDELYDKPVEWMNERLFVQHFYALQEIYDLGKMTQTEYDAILGKYNSYYY